MKKNFTATEVGALIENFDKKLTVVAEDVSEVKERLIGVEGRLEKVETRLTAVEDVVKVAIPNLSKRVTTLEKKAG